MPPSMTKLPLPLKSAKRMTGRDPNEHHRVASSLELLFDLVFVVAVAAVASKFHHALVEHHIGEGIFNFGFGFFAIFWAWLNYTWFASAYDTDDRAFRLLTMLQMFGALVLAVAVANFASDKTSTVVSVIGYAIMRLALASQWLRASMQDPARRQTCRRYAIGISLVQLGWIGRLWLPDSLQVPSLLLFWLGEILVPVIAERTGNTPWHAHHIAERYSLFVIIVLGEGILGTTNAVAAAINSPEDWLSVGVFGFGALGLIFAMWWLYFEPKWAESLHHFRNKISFVFGYGHYFVLAGLVALGSAFEVTTDQIVQHLAEKHPKAVAYEAIETVAENAHHPLTNGYVAMCVAGAVAVFLTAYTLTRWLMLDKHHNTGNKLWLAYGLAMVWLVAMMALYHFTEFNSMWLGWVMAVSPMVMTLVCAKDVEFEH